MRKLFLMGCAFLFGASLNAAKYDGVAPCDGPDVRATPSTTTNSLFISSESRGGFLCAISVSTRSDAAATVDYVVCADSRPTAGTTVGAPFNITSPFNDPRILGYAFAISTNAVTRVEVKASFRNLNCDNSSIATPGMVYWVPQ